MRNAAMARALWMTGPGRVEVRNEPITGGPDAVLVAARFGGISRGTEALVLRGGVPETEWARMRAPLQAGEFPYPVKYGYATVGMVVDGTGLPAGQSVFVLHPHQDHFSVPASMAIPLPPGVPEARAVLAANVETGLNIVWDAGAAPADRIAIVGAGVVGALAGWLCARLPGAEVTLVDVNPERAALAAALGCRFAAPETASGTCDIVIHTSASPAGLATALDLAGPEATVVEASWYGDCPVPAGLGGAFHSQRLRLVSSQVGAVPAARRARWSNRRRLEAALALCADPALDVLISGETAFDDLPGAYAGILDRPGTLCHRIRY